MVRFQSECDADGPLYRFFATMVEYAWETWVGSCPGEPEPWMILDMRVRLRMGEQDEANAEDDTAAAGGDELWVPPGMDLGGSGMLQLMSVRRWEEADLGLGVVDPRLVSQLEWNMMHGR
jgi:hypothetical protein